MNVRGTITGVLAALSIIVIGWEAGTVTSTPSDLTGSSLGVGSPSSAGSGDAVSGAAGSGAAGSGNGAPAASAAPATPATPAAAGLVDGTYTGAAATTRWGDVQVRVTVSGGVIADATALSLPDVDGHSRQLAARAEPVLRSSVIGAATVDGIDMVSGATYTSRAYEQSLQSALDQAAS